MTSSHAFSRDLRQPHVITSGFDCFSVLSVSFVIGWGDDFGFLLVLRRSIEARSISVCLLVSFYFLDHFHVVFN